MNTDEQREFAIRYYRWALEQWRSEIDGGFPILRGIRDSSCTGTLEIMKTQSRDERLEMARTLTKRRHPEAVAALGDTFSTEEQRLFEHWRHLRATLYWESAEYAAVGQPRKKRIAPLRAAIRQVVAPVVGKEVDCCHGVLYRYETRIGRWTVATRIDFTDRQADIIYDHLIRLSEDSRRFAGPISVEKWFGISGVSEWRGLSDEEIPEAVANLALVCRRFLEAAPYLLPQ